MEYDPFARGEFPVGVSTVELRDAERDRTLPVEIWYPASEQARGKDVSTDTRDTYELWPGLPASWQLALRDAAAREGRFPLVIFSHGFAGHRRQSTFWCTHLASHGYVVAAPDHVGNTAADLIQRMMTGKGDSPNETFAKVTALRPPDIRFVIDAITGGQGGQAAASIDGERIGMSGHSFGGWTTLATVATEPRIQSTVPLAPAGGMAALRELIDFDWGRPVPTLVIVADRDSLLPLEPMRELYEDIAEPKQLIVLDNTDHMHFCDAAKRTHELFRSMPMRPSGELRSVPMPPFDELAPAAHAYDVICGSGLAHFDATLKDADPARALLGQDPVAMFAERGIKVRR